MNIELKILDERLKAAGMLPAYATDGSAAVDLRAVRFETTSLFKAGYGYGAYGDEWDMQISPGGHATFSTGMAIHIKDPGYAALALPRSGIGFKHGIVLRNTVGLIDSDYQGCIKVCLENTGSGPFVVSSLDRIAQLVIIPVIRAHWQIVDEFSAASGRGANGFGSSGVK